MPKIIFQPLMIANPLGRLTVANPLGRLTEDRRLTENLRYSTDRIGRASVSILCVIRGARMLC